MLRCVVCLRKQLGEWLALAASHTEWAFGRRVDDLAVIDAEGVADGSVEVGCGDLVLDHAAACLVGGAVNLAALDAAACHEGGEGFRVVVAASILVDL